MQREKILGLDFIAADGSNGSIGNDRGYHAALIESRALSYGMGMNGLRHKDHSINGQIR